MVSTSQATHAARAFSIVVIIAAGWGVASTATAAPEAPAPAAKVTAAGLGTILVYGNAETRARRLVQAALEDAARTAGWQLVAAPTGGDASQLMTCLTANRPWSCLSPIATRGGFDRILAVAVNDGSKGELVLAGRLVISSDAAPAGHQRFCRPCSDQDLALHSVTLAQQLIAASSVSAGRTTLEIHTIPPGAVILLDNKMIGGIDRVISTSPGAHTVALELSGYEPEVRHVTVREGERVKIEVRFRPARTTANSSARRSTVAPSRENVLPSWAPLTMIGAGGLAVVAGSWISLAADPGVGTKQRRFDYSVSGLVIAGGGAVALGVGLALWRWPLTKARSVPIVSLLPGGAVAGLTASF